MKNFKKAGLTALCGSLVAITAAQAGEMAVTGGINATWTKLNTGSTGNPLGMATNLSFTGSGELDGGQDVSVLIAHADQDGYSSANITLTTNSLGKFKVSQAEGGAGIGGYDDNMPRAWEETWDTGIGAGIDLAKGVGSSTNIGWTSPSFGGTTLQVAYAGRNDGVAVNDKATSGGTGVGEGLDIVLDTSQSIGGASLDLFAGYSRTERDPETAMGPVGRDDTKDREEGVAGVTLGFGPVKAGLQSSVEYTGDNFTDTDVFGYRNVSWGVSFNVSDNLSVSYAEFESKQGKVAGGAGIARPLITVESIQIAYTMGGASIKIGESDVDNAAYVTGTSGDKESTTVMLSLAF